MIANDELRKAIGYNVRRLRRDRELTQAALAEEIHVTPVYLHRIETGASCPSSEVLFALADALGVKADELRQLSPIGS